MPAPRPPAKADPFGALTPLVSALGAPPLPPLVLVLGDDDWIVGEAVKRLAAAFRKAFVESEVATYDDGGNGVKEAVADAATVALFSTNRLVTLDGSHLFRTQKLSADEIDGLLDEALEAGLSAGPSGREEPRALDRLARKARTLALAAGAALDGDTAEVARKLCGRVRRADRAADLAALLARPVDDSEAAETALSRLLDFASRATPGDNVLLLHAVSPDLEHQALRELRRGPTATFFAADDAARRERLHSLGLERTIDRSVSVDADVFDTLTDRGRLTARAFLSELDKLVDAAPSGRVTAEAAARLVADERKEYGSDFVEAFAQRRFVDALRVLDRLMASDDFTAFRSFGKEEGSAKKGPKGEAAFFPLLGLLAADVRRMLALKAALGESRGRRADYRAFVDRVLPALKTHAAGAPPIPLDGHPFVLHKAYLATFDWSLPELVDCLTGLAAVDRGVKTGLGSGPELLEALLLSRVRRPPGKAAGLAG